MVGGERCLNKMSIYFQIMLTSFMSAVIPTSAGAVPFYDDLHCKKFAYTSEQEQRGITHPRGDQNFNRCFDEKNPGFLLLLGTRSSLHLICAARFYSLKSYIHLSDLEFSTSLAAPITKA